MRGTRMKERERYKERQMERNIRRAKHEKDQSKGKCDNTKMEKRQQSKERKANDTEKTRNKRKHNEK